MTSDWTGTHYLENKIIPRGRMGPKLGRVQVKELPVKHLNLHEHQLEMKRDPWELIHLSLLLWHSQKEMGRALHASDPGRTQWKSKLQQGHCTAPEPGCSPVLMAADRKAVRHPSTKEGYTAFQDKEACGSFKGAPVVNHQPADTIAKTQTGCGACATQCPVANACWPRRNAEGWPWSTDQNCVTTALMPLCVLLINSVQITAAHVFWMSITHFFLLVHYCI